MREAVILDVMTQNARSRTHSLVGLRRVLVVIAAILFFPAVLIGYLIWWLILRLRR